RRKREREREREEERERKREGEEERGRERERERACERHSESGARTSVRARVRARAAPPARSGTHHVHVAVGRRGAPRADHAALRLHELAQHAHLHDRVERDAGSVGEALCLLEVLLGRVAPAAPRRARRAISRQETERQRTTRSTATTTAT